MYAHSNIYRVSSQCLKEISKNFLESLFRKLQLQRLETVDIQVRASVYREFAMLTASMFYKDPNRQVHEARMKIYIPMETFKTKVKLKEEDFKMTIKKDTRYETSYELFHVMCTPETIGEHLLDNI